MDCRYCAQEPASQKDNFVCVNKQVLLRARLAGRLVFVCMINTTMLPCESAESELRSVSEPDEPYRRPWLPGHLTANATPRVHVLVHRSCWENSTVEPTSCSGKQSVKKIASDASRCNNIKKCIALTHQFTKEVRMVEQYALNIPGVDKVHAFTMLPKEIVSDPKWQKHIAPGSRGRGYWFWKPVLINLLMRNGELRDGDLLFYTDADARGYLGTLQRALAQRGTWDLKINGLGEGCQMSWTKGDIFKRFNTTWDDPQYGLSWTTKANFFTMWINSRTLRFVQLWEELVSDFHLVSDEPSHDPSLDGPCFKENRHDQALLSMLLHASEFAHGPCGIPDMFRNNPQCVELRSFKSSPKQWARHPYYGIEGFHYNR